MSEELPKSPMSEAVRPSAPKAQKRTGWAELANGDTVELAPPSRRLGARVLDFIIRMAVFFVPALVYILVSVFSAIDLDGEVSDSDFARLDSLEIPGLNWILLLWLVVAFGYEVVQTAIWGQTIGKRMTGVKVINGVDGGVPGWGKATGRWAIPGLLWQIDWIVPLVGSILALLVYLSLTWDRVYQGWHDRAAGTLVIKQ